MEKKSRLKMPVLLSVLTVCLFAADRVVAQDFDKVEIVTTKITSSIYMLTGSGGNIGLCIGDDATFIVDDQFAPLTPKIKAAIAKLTDKPVSFVINTHWHYDHTDGNETFGGEGAIIVSHENSRKRMTTDQLIAMFDKKQAAYSAEGLPKVTFTESITFHLNGETINVFHPGSAHTDGDALVHFATSNVIHGGDIFVRYGFPFIDQPNGGSVDGMIRSIDHLARISNSETQFIPGHGALSNKTDLMAFGYMLKTIRDRVQNGIDAGKSYDEVLASDPTAGFEERGVPKAGFVKSIYDSLVK